MRDGVPKKSLARLMFGLAMVIILSRSLLWVLNQFVDSTFPSQETMIVEGTGKHYQPFREDYLSGRSGVLNRTVRVPVLPEVAAETAIGSRTQIVVGKGLFKKTWIQPKDNYEKNSDGTFRVVYVSMFVTCFVVGSMACLKFFSPFGKVRAIQAYCLAIALGAILFYLF